MSIARAIRLVLSLVAICIVVWSFYDVGRRAVIKRQSEHDRPIVLTVLHWGDKAEDVIVQNLIDRYEADHPNVRLVRINPGGPNYRPKIKTMMAAGTPPDVFYLPPDIFPELAHLKVVRPIDDYVARERATGNAAYLDDFWPILIKAWQFDTQTGLVGSGPLYGLPKDCTTAVIYINVDLFEKAGIDWRRIQKDGWTWAEYEQVVRKIRDLNNTPEFAGRNIYGGAIELFTDALRNIVWTYGGDFFAKKPGGTPDFRHLTLDQPEAMEALDMVRRLRLEDRTLFNSTGSTNVNDLAFQEFIAGNIGCEGPVGRWKVPRLMGETRFRWDCLPVPYKDKKFAASQVWLTAWSMSSATKHPDECFELIKFLCGPTGAIQQARAGLAIPPLMSVARSSDFLNPPGMPPHNAQAFLDAMAGARLQQLPREQEWRSLVEDQAARAVQLGNATIPQVVADIQSLWLAILDSPLRRREWSPVHWGVILTVTAGLLAALGAFLSWRARREKLGPLDRAQERAGFLFVAPWVLGFLALTLGPMVLSLLLSFTQWTAMTPLSDARSVGVANYKQLFGNDPLFYQSLRVTLYFVLLSVPVTQAIALGVAVLMNTRVRGITVFRTIYFVPSVVSGVALAVLWRQIFNADYGLMNAALRPVLRLFGTTPPDWFGVDAHRFAIPAFVIMGLWGVGSGMIIYLAGLKGIPASMYEAATIDGAGGLRRFWNVTLPMLSPLIFYNVVMGIIGSFQVFTQAMVMTGGGPNNATLFYVLNLYRQAFEFHNMGYASALAWVLFVLILALTIAIFRGSKNLVYYEGLKT
jgi:multiple sugar transport system permease protein